MQDLQKKCSICLRKFDLHAEKAGRVMQNLIVQVVAIGSALLRRLKLYAATARTTEVAEQLVKGHTSSGPQLTMQQVSKLINTLSTHLVDLSEELLKSDHPMPANASTVALAQKQGALLLLRPHSCLHVCAPLNKSAKKQMLLNEVHGQWCNRHKWPIHLKHHQLCLHVIIMGVLLLVHDCS